MLQGKFITLEGSEGAGKSTALEYIREYFARAHIDIVVTREPGGTPIAEEIRQLLLHHSSSETMRPETELLLMFACRAQHVAHCILPALQAGKWVVSDRFVDASYAYQGGGRGVDVHDIEAIDNIVVDDVYPDLTLLLDVPVTIGIKREEKRGAGKDRIEQEKLEFFERVREAYLERARQNSARIKVIDASQPLDKVKKQIHQVLDEFRARQMQ